MGAAGSGESMASYALIVDPDAAAASGYAATLKELGLSALVVRGDGPVVATLLARGVPALLLTELTLPGLSGFALLERLRRTAPHVKTQVVVVSADRALRDRAAMLRSRLGIGAILAKAASEESVKRVIRVLLDLEDTAAAPVVDEPPVTGMRLIARPFEPQGGLRARLRKTRSGW